MSELNGDLTTIKSELIADVALGNKTVDEAYAEFAKEGQGLSDEIVASLNALN